MAQCPSDEQSRCQLFSEGFACGDIDGVDYNCLTESLLQVLLQKKMIKCPSVAGSVSQWKRAASEDVRKYLCLHEDERLWPMQRDEHNRICDVYRDQHNLAYLNHKSHSAHIIHYVFKHFAGDAVHIVRRTRVIVHTRFDSMFHDAKHTEDISDVSS